MHVQYNRIQTEIQDGIMLVCRIEEGMIIKSLGTTALHGLIPSPFNSK